MSGDSRLTPFPGGRATRPESEEDLWDVHRAAKFLAMSHHWVYKMVAQGLLPYRKIGSSVRFVPAELRAWAVRQPGKADGRSSGT